MSKCLLVLAGPDEGRVIPLTAQPVLLGRSRAAEVKLIDSHVAQVHCQLHFEDDHVILTDFDSEGGTFVNGQRISVHPLLIGDIVRIGATRLQLAEDDEGDVPARQGPTLAKATTQLQRKTVTAGPAKDWSAGLTGQKFGQFMIGSLLARGKSGCVFHARYLRKNVDVALKVLDPSFTAREDLVQRFVAGMKKVLPLQHPNLVLVHGAGKTGPHCWVAMEYVRGENLAAAIGRIETAGMLDWRRVLRIVIYLARALVYAHGQGVIHHCVTPQNILLSRDLAKTKLADMMLDSAMERDPTVPHSRGEPSGDLPYMSPERTDGPGKPVDARTDIYSLGASAYAALTGQPPFQGTTAADVVAKIRLQAPPSLKLLHFGLPETFEFMILKMLAKRPEDRYQSAQELLTSLERFAESQKII